MAERLVLASRSPQRRAILEQLGISFEVRAGDVVEQVAGVPEAVAAQNALRKALAVEAAPGEVVLGVDTLVALELDIFGKPPTAEAAAGTLRRLAGRSHRVLSAIALRRGTEVQTAAAVTEVAMRPLDERAIARYVAAGEWRGRAGGYAIQGRGAALVTAVKGDYLNVVGLPVTALVDLWPGVLELVG